MNRDIEEIKSDFKKRFIVCPMPIHWKEIHEILLNNNKNNIKIDNPLILAGWGASDKEKFERFFYHLSIAQALGVLSKILNYLYTLDYDAFLYSDELKSAKPLDEKGYWDLLNKDFEEVNQAISPALNILEKIQHINKEIIDEDILYNLFIKNGFNKFNEPKVKKGNSLFIDLMIELGDIFDSQKCLMKGSEDLEDFCYEIFNLKNKK